MEGVSEGEITLHCDVSPFVDFVSRFVLYG